MDMPNEFHREGFQILSVDGEAIARVVSSVDLTDIDAHEAVEIDHEMEAFADLLTASPKLYKATLDLVSLVMTFAQHKDCSVSTKVLIVNHPALTVAADALSVARGQVPL